MCALEGGWLIHIRFNITDVVYQMWCQLCPQLQSSWGREENQGRACCCVAQEDFKRTYYEK